MNRFISLLVVLLVSLVAGASSVPRVDVATQVDRADLIFIGTVAAMESVPTADGNFAFTYVTFDVSESIKGTTRGRSVTLRMAGGEAGPNVFEVAGAPRFAVGGQHLLFVEGNDRLGIPLVGWNWGKLDVVSDPTTKRPILLDHTRRAINGIDGAGWKRSAVAINEDGTARRPEVKVLAQEGVKIQLEEPEAVVVEPASNALAQLKLLVAGRRATSAAYRQPRFESAEKHNVPATFAFDAQKPLAQKAPASKAQE